MRLFSELDDARDYAFQAKARGVEDHGAGGGFQGGGFALGVAFVALLYGPKDVFEFSFTPGLEGAPAGPFFGRGRKKDL